MYDAKYKIIVFGDKGVGKTALVFSPDPINREITVKDGWFVPGVYSEVKNLKVDEKEITTDEGLNFSKSRGVDAFIECSSKTGENVEQVFETVTRLILQRFGPFNYLEEMAKLIGEYEKK